MENTSSAMNAVLRSIPFKSGEVRLSSKHHSDFTGAAPDFPAFVCALQTILDLSTAYAMNRELASYLTEFRGVKVLTVGVQFAGEKCAPTGTLPQSLVRAPALYRIAPVASPRPSMIHTRIARRPRSSPTMRRDSLSRQ